jgi:hypothetical protein
MKQTVYLDDFRRAFHDCGRGNQFSYEGLKVLFDCFEELDDSTGQETELDVIALCCEFEESYYLDVASNYEIDVEGLEEVEAREKVIEYVQDHTLYCGMTREDNLVFAQF